MKQFKHELIILSISFLFFGINLIPGISFYGDAASTIEIKNLITDNIALENTSYAILFRGDAPIYPYLLSFHKLFGIKDIYWGVFLNSIFFSLFVVSIFYLSHKLTNNLKLSYFSAGLLITNYNLTKFTTSPLSVSLNCLFLGIFLYQLLFVEKYKTKTLVFWGIIASFAFMNNYIIFPLLAINSLKIHKQHKWKSFFTYSVAIGVIPLFSILSKTNGVNKGVLLPGKIVDFPLKITLLSIVQNFANISLNYNKLSYILPILFIALSLFVYIKFYQDQKVNWLLNYIGLFFLLSLPVYFFFDYEATLKAKRGINIAVVFILLVPFVLSKFNNKKLTHFLMGLLLGYNLIFWGQGYSHKLKVGPPQNYYAWQNSKVIKKARELSNKGAWIITNNPVSMYMYLGKRPIRGARSSKELKEHKNMIHNSKHVYFLQVNIAPGKYSHLDAYQEFLEVQDIDMDDAARLVKFL